MDISKKINKTKDVATLYKPTFFRLSNADDQKAFSELCASDAVCFIHDEIQDQLKELVKCNHPSLELSAVVIDHKIKEHLGHVNPFNYGVWVYFPWNLTMVHLLDEEEFILVRTNRNQLKITAQEQEQLRQKTIGIIGLSVGQSIALTLAMERTCGTLRLADFDHLELSNLNRIRAGVKGLGLPKVIIAAREIAELDPFLKVDIYSEGINAANISEFMTAKGKLDLLVEVCDGLDMKVFCRLKARELKIPVVMDTNDRGMLDIERFDLEPERKVMHGLLEGIPMDNMQELTQEQRTALILKIVGAEFISRRLKTSITELRKSISALPQLASSVVLGGAVTTDVCRRILLDELAISGRFYVDLDEIISDLQTPSSKK